MVIQAVAFFILTFLPANFDYLWFAILLFILGIGQGMFAAPNTTAIMNSVPADQRGVASGMRATFQNAATLVSLAAFFTIIIIGLDATLSTTLLRGRHPA